MPYIKVHAVDDLFYKQWQQTKNNYSYTKYYSVFSVLHMLRTMSVDSHHLDLVPQLTPRCHSDETWDQ